MVPTGGNASARRSAAVGGTAGLALAVALAVAEPVGAPTGFASTLIGATTAGPVAALYSRRSIAEDAIAAYLAALVTWLLVGLLAVVVLGAVFSLLAGHVSLGHFLFGPWLFLGSLGVVPTALGSLAVAAVLGAATAALREGLRRAFRRGADLRGRFQ